MSQEVIKVKHIKAVSPTLAETLRLCKLRAGLSRSGNAQQYVLGNPKAWLGTAYHAVLEGMGQGHGDTNARVRSLWGVAIEKLHLKSRTHPLDRRFGSPESWPGYHLIAAMARIRAAELIGAVRQKGSPDAKDQGRNSTAKEPYFSSANGKIVGRPDVVRHEEVVDYKTGSIFEEEDPEKVKSSYLSQLRLYAYLINEAQGWWPHRGVLLPMKGAPVTVELPQDECEEEAAKAEHLLDEYNYSITHDISPEELASPSADNCRWCSFQLCCPAFWGSVGPDWAAGLHADAFEGTATGTPEVIHGGEALAASIQVGRGTVQNGETVSLHPLNRSTYPALSLVRAGIQVRVIGLWRRADGRVVPTKRTVIAEETSIPAIIVDPGGG